jgi:MYND finger
MRGTTDCGHFKLTAVDVDERQSPVGCAVYRISCVLHRRGLGKVVYSNKHAQSKSFATFNHAISSIFRPNTTRRMTLRQHCGQCQTTSTQLLICGRCQSVVYCNAECQRQHWSEHRSGCLPKVGAAAAARKRDPLLDNRQLDFMRRLCHQKIDDGVIVTLDDLEAKLETVRAVAGPMRSLEAVIQQAMCYGRFASLPLRYDGALRVGRSTLHGDGVFATRRIPANVIITLYPCDAVVDTKTGQLWINPMDDGLDLRADERTLLETYNVTLSVENGLDIVGNPRRRENTKLLGHLINEAARDTLAWPAVERMANPKLMASVVSAYCRESLTKSNCSFACDSAQTVMVLMTTRTIQPEQEILLSYGPIHWLAQHYGVDYARRFPFLALNLEQIATHLQPNRVDRK